MDSMEISGRATDGIVALLVKSGWLQALADGDGNVGCLRWTPLGRTRQTLLRHVIVEYGLDGEDGAAARFTRECQTHSRARSKAAEAARDFWLACLEETGLHAEESWLGAYVRLIRSCCDMPHCETSEQTLATFESGTYAPRHAQFEPSGGKRSHGGI